jgi:isoquinoline 1-oxidoreductase subunit alpha
LAGAEIRTIEDIGANGLHPVQKMWMQFNVPQCGYCQRIRAAIKAAAQESA